MTKSTDLHHEWGEDLQVSSKGDLLATNDFNLLRQRIIRRLLTNPKDILCEPDFGIGAGRYIDENLTPELYAAIRRRVIEQVYKEDIVARNPEPEISFTPDPNGNGLYVHLKLWTRDNKQLDLNLRISP